MRRFALVTLITLGFASSVGTQTPPIRTGCCQAPVPSILRVTIQGGPLAGVYVLVNDYDSTKPLPLYDAKGTQVYVRGTWRWTGDLLGFTGKPPMGSKNVEGLPNAGQDVPFPCINLSEQPTETGVAFFLTISTDRRIYGAFCETHVCPPVNVPFPGGKLGATSVRVTP